MARVQLADWGTYYKNSGTTTPSEGIDTQNRWSISYEQDLSNGITTIYVQPYLKIYSSGGISSSISASISTTINGVTKNQTISKSNAGYSPGYEYQYGSTQSFKITHENNGTAQCVFSGLMTISGTRRTASHTWDLPTINVASTITNNTSNSSRIDFGVNVEFSIVRPNDTITHVLTYEVNGITYTIGDLVDTSILYSFPLDLINSYPSNAEVAITVNCTSSNGTIASTIVYLKIPDSYVPTLSLAISDVGSVPKDWGIYVKGKSKLNGIISASGVANSTIKRYSASANNQTFSESEFTTSELNTSGSMTIKASVVDTRDRPANVSESITVYDYSTPTYVKIEVVRCDSLGNEDNDGTYGKVVCQYSISPCNNKNLKILEVSYGLIVKTFVLDGYNGTIVASVNELFSELDITSNHTFTFKLIDSFSEIPQSYVMPPSFVLVSKLAGGKGLTIGRIATEEGFHIYMASDFHNGISIDGVSISETLEQIKKEIDSLK